MNVIVVDTSSWISYFKGKEIPNLDGCFLSEDKVFKQVSQVVKLKLLE